MFHPIRNKKLTNSGYRWLQWTGQTYHPGEDENTGAGNSDLGEDIFFCNYGSIYKTARSNDGYGNQLITKHKNYFTRFAHLRTFDAVEGQEVSPFESLCEMGNSGTTSAHLHFEVLRPDFVSYLESIRPNDWWKFYPVEKSRSWVASRYINPLSLITMFLLVKGDVSPQVYAVDQFGSLHLIINEAQFLHGHKLGMWEDWTGIVTKPQQEVDAMPHDSPITFGL